MNCSSFALTSDPAADPPEFTLHCTSAAGPIRAFHCTSSATGTITGVATLTDSILARYNLSVAVTGQYPGDYVCQVRVERYDGGEPETLVIPEVPGPLQTISVTGI